MKHRIKHNQLGRNRKQAKALYRGLILSLIQYGKIETTLAKAKSVIGDVDRVINFAKENSVNAKRQLVKMMGNNPGLDKFFSAIPESSKNRSSGHSRIIKTGKRLSDGTEMAILELVDVKIEKPAAKIAAVAGEKESKPSGILEGEIVEAKNVKTKQKTAKSKKEIKPKAKTSK